MIRALTLGMLIGLWLSLAGCSAPSPVWPTWCNIVSGGDIDKNFACLMKHN